MFWLCVTMISSASAERRTNDAIGNRPSISREVRGYQAGLEKHARHPGCDFLGRIVWWNGNRQALGEARVRDVPRALAIACAIDRRDCARHRWPTGGDRKGKCGADPIAPRYGNGNVGIRRVLVGREGERRSKHYLIASPRGNGGGRNRIDRRIGE
jgi:hypothetical protein